MILNLGSMVLVSSLVLASTSPAFAKGRSGGEKTPSFSCSLTDVSLFGSNSVDCEGPISGNDVGNKGTLLTKLNVEGVFNDSLEGTGTWSILGKSDDSGSGVKADQNQTTGDWFADLTEVKANYSAIAISLKAANGYSTYLFNDLSGAQAKGMFDGLFNTIGAAQNNKGNAQALSHLTVAYFTADDAGTGPIPIPEPTTMVGLMAVGAGIVINRRKQSQ